MIHIKCEGCGHLGLIGSYLTDDEGVDESYLGLGRFGHGDMVSYRQRLRDWLQCWGPHGALC